MTLTPLKTHGNNLETTRIGTEHTTFFVSEGGELQFDDTWRGAGAATGLGAVRSILNKYDEIVVMKLVGATDAFIHRPFLYTGFWYGLLGGLMAWFAVIIILWWMDSSITTFAAMYQKDFNITGLTGSALLTMLGLSVLLGLLGSLISVQRHVREIEPK